VSKFIALFDNFYTLTQQDLFEKEAQRQELRRLAEVCFQRKAIISTSCSLLIRKENGVLKEMIKEKTMTQNTRDYTEWFSSSRERSLETIIII